MEDTFACVQAEGAELRSDATEVQASRSRAGRGDRPVDCDVGPCKERNNVERLNNGLKAWRGIAER
ncbi:hypothetical protein J0910_30205 [Nocardiopsis sp. CNT-189]|uniref:hypothetical protein n=1 Tax=Nocardiopsis oceanisediminis TaxID=2816862 RepID=UPI003B2CF716